LAEPAQSGHRTITRLAIAEDQRMIRELLVALLLREPDIEVVGEARTGPEALELAGSLHPDVLVLDISLPDIGGVEVTRTLKKTQPGLKILALSIHTEKHFIKEMLKAGADGYLVKSSALTELVQAIRIVAEGKMYLSPDIARETVSDFLSPHPAAENNGVLGLREQQVLALLAGGKRTSEIAAQLHISVATVEAHRRNIMRKLDLHTVADLTKYAIRNGLTSL
jgi:two-component system NarL family response regulator